MSGGFWIVTMICVATGPASYCRIPDRAENPALAVYSSREVCEERLKSVQAPPQVEWRCVEVAADTLFYNDGFGFSEYKMGSPK